MTSQNYQNHRRIKPETRANKIYYACVTLLFILSVVYLCKCIMNANGRVVAGLLVLTSISLVIAYFLFRPFALKAQDRAIRAEENLRHFAMTGKLLDKNITIQQITALRFAPDEEFLGLVERAVKENLSNDDIKKAIKNWKADTYRV